MADIKIATEAKPLFASDGGVTIYVDSTTKEFSAMDDVGNARQLRPFVNFVASTRNPASHSVG